MQRIHRINKQSSRGISLVEVTIAITLLPLIITSFILVLDKTLFEARNTAIQTALSSDASFAIDWLERDIRLATAFNPDIATPYEDNYEPSGDWDYAGNGTDQRVLILSIPSTTLRSGTSSRVLTHIDGGTYNCDEGDQLTYNPVLTYRAIYFVEDGDLYKRYLTDTATDRCNDQIQKQSCPAANQDSWPSSCQAKDELIASKVSQFSIDYYEANETTPISDAYSDSSTLLGARAVGITLTLSQTSGSDTIERTVNLKSSRVN